ncbi:hypothetical protein ACFQX9_16935 [Bradyrhizobium sp. GCM10028915]|uniref:hypothetical protein n=1 Tax=Bradyrhizobium sp. GCM10028915 TaxID=3273385 RepID=UPI00362281DB
MRRAIWQASFTVASLGQKMRSPSPPGSRIRGLAIGSRLLASSASCNGLQARASRDVWEVISMRVYMLKAAAALRRYIDDRLVEMDRRASAIARCQTNEECMI